MAMTNGAMYDVLMGFDRTHQPFKHAALAPAGASQQAAVAQAAYQTLMFAYPGEQPHSRRGDRDEARRHSRRPREDGRHRLR